MRSTKVISISMPEAQVNAAEQLAKAENRTMSELVREALRSYEKQKRAETTEKYRARAKEKNITEADVVRIIKEVRRGERGKITLTPKSIIDRIPQVVKDVRAASKRKGLDQISREEINAEVAAVRSQKKAPARRRNT